MKRGEPHDDPAGRGGVWELCIRRPVLTTVATIGLVIAGWIGFDRLPIRQLPDVDFPVVSVFTVLPGASPEVVEREVTEILESEVNTVEGIKTLTSESREEVSSITAEFTLDRDVDVAAQDIRDKVSRARGRLPEDADEPIVSKLDLDAQAILWLSLNSDTHAPVELSEVADDLVKERLQRLAGVGRVIIGAWKEFAVRVRVDADRLAAHGLTIQDLTAAFDRENVDLPSGRIENVEREFVIRTDAQFPTPESFSEMVIAYREETPVRLGDVAVAEGGIANERTVGRFTGRPTVGLGILKQSKANTVAVADAVKEALPEIRRELPDGFRLEESYDSSIFIRESVDHVRQTLQLGGLLVVVVIFLFLGSLRSTVIPAIVMPTATIATFGLMYFLDFSLNTLTLLALTLAVGVIVDDAIVVLESAYRHMESGEDRLTASRRGTREIAFAVVASSLSLCAVFLPVAFLSGVTGRFFFEFGMTVVGVIGVSTALALTLTPMLCSRYLAVGERASRLARRLGAALERLSEGYRRLLHVALAHRAAVVAIAVVSAGASVWLFGAVGKEFFPEEDRGSFVVATETPEGSTVGHHDRYQQAVEAILLSTPEVRNFASFVGLSSAGPGEVNSGIIFVRLHPRERRARSQEAVMDDVRRRARRLSGVNVYLLGGSSFVGSRGKPLEFVIQNPDFPALAGASRRFLDAVRETPGFRDVDVDLRLNKPELRVSIDRDKAASLGVSARDVADTLRVLFGGEEVTKFQRGNKRFDVIVQLRDEDRRLPGDVSSVYVRARSGELVPLSNLVLVEEGVGPRSLNHYNRRRSVILDANLVGKPLGTALAEVRALADRLLPEGFTTAVAGQTKDFLESSESLGFAFALAVLAVYLVLAGQFESFVHPFTVLLALPLATVGSLLALAAFGMTLNVFSVIGMIMLVGLVTKNSILLVDYANQLRARGLGAREAMEESGRVRLRPVLMTAVTTIFGILPVALGLGAGAESRRPMGVAVALGMTTSTLLTLIVVPVVYTLLDDVLGRLTRRPDARRAGEEAPRPFVASS